MVCWAFNFVALKLVYGQIDPSTLALTRFAVMWSVLALICRLAGFSLRYAKEDFIRLMTLGFLSMGVYIIVFLEGMQRTTATDGAILLATSPIWTALIAVLFRHERFSWGALGGAVVAFGGVAFVVLSGSQGGHGQVIGNVLILISALLWALCAVLTRPMVEKYPPIQALTLSLPGALPLLLVYGLWSTVQTPWMSLSTVTWLSFLHVCLLAGVVGFIGFYAGVKQIGSGNAMLYQYFVTPLAAGFAWLVLGQPPAPLQLIGLVIVVMGVVWSTRSRSASPPPLSEPG